jgi:hypothetical protein
VKRWERPVVGEGWPKDPAKRVEYLLAAPQEAPDHGAAALLMVFVHASTALRCRRAVLDALADRAAPDSSLRVIGEGSMAAVSLYLAARAAQRYCEEHNEPGPLGRRRLDELVSTAEHLRDCVMHWDDKGREASPAFLNVTDHDLVVLGSARDRQSTIAGLTWKMFEWDVDRLRRWAEYKLDERVASADDAIDDTVEVATPEQVP